MREETLTIANPTGEEGSLPLTFAHTLAIGSGAAGLNAAVQLKAGGVDDLLIVTEGLQMGTSINTGSDKQTYYKLSLCGDDADAPRGVPFPRDAYGQFIGYKTDHDPRQRATSIGPYTSREMCRALIRQVRRMEIPIREGRNVVQLLTVGEGDDKRAAGAVLVTEDGTLEAVGAENVVFATGGPGGLYKTSVYPQVHTGGIGLALVAGALAQNLPESQYGMASIKFRWNVSGTYMQVIPRFISTAADGTSDEREFLREYFDGVGQLCSNVFLKGYQWPFDSRKAVGGSSIIDILVYIETVI
ncbi:MAG: FAD-binding protein, partial [Planctomycetota bacterium]